MSIKPSQHVVSQLVTECGSALIAIARNWSNNPEDLVQTAFSRLLQQDVFPDNPKAWLFQVVRNLGREHIRSSVRRRERERRVAKHESVPAVDQNDLTNRTLAALEKLSVEDKELVIMRLWGDMNLQEISNVVGDSVSTVHRRYHQALRQLKSIVENPEIGARP